MVTINEVMENVAAMLADNNTKMSEKIAILTALVLLGLDVTPEGSKCVNVILPELNNKPAGTSGQI